MIANETASALPKAATPEQPWPGLAPFEEGDSHFFKGREAAISALTRLVMREDLTLLWAFSGLGKTSLLRAGLFPRLRDADVFPVYVRLRYDAGDPPLVEQCLDAIEDAARRWQYETPPRAGAKTLFEYSRRRQHRFWSPKDRLVTPLLVFDQFEEIFVNGRVRESADVSTFFGQLSSAVTGITTDDGAGDDEYLFQAGVFKVLLSFREDYVAQAAKCAPLITGIGHRYYRLESLTFDDAVDVVREGGGHLVENVNPAAHEGLCRSIVDHVANTTDEAAARSHATVDPALLSLYCSQLNERRRELQKTTIDATLLEAGQASTIIPDFYDACMREVSPAARATLEKHLVLCHSRTRNSIAEETLLEQGVMIAELNHLIDRRILRRDTTRQPRIEFTHDVLVAPALHALELREAAEQRAEDEEKRLANERQRAADFKWKVLVVLTVLGLIAFVMSWRALELSREQTIRLLVQASTKELSADPQLSAVFSSWAAGAARGQSADLQTLAADALNRSVRAASPDGTYAVTGSSVVVNASGSQAAVISADQRSVQLLNLADAASRVQPILASDGKSVFTVKFVAKDTVLLLLNSDASVDRVRLSDMTNRVESISTNTAGFEKESRTNPFPAGARRPTEWAITHDGKVVVLSATSRNYADLQSSPQAPMPPAERYWLSVADARADLFTREMPSASISSVALAANGSRYAVFEGGKTVTINEVDGDVVSRRSFPPSAITVNPDGTLVLVLPEKTGPNHAGELIVWNVARQTESRVALPRREEIVSALFSPDGAVFAVLQRGGVTQFWNAKTLEPILPAPLSAISVRFSPDGRFAMTWAPNGAAEVWRLDGSERAVSARSGTDAISDAAFVGGSDRVAILTASGLTIWTTAPSANAVDTTIDTNQAGLRVLALGPDGRSATVGGQNGTVAISVADRTARPATTVGGVTAMAYSADGAKLAVATITPPQSRHSSISRVVVHGERTELTHDVGPGTVTVLAFVGADRLAYAVSNGDFASGVEILDLQSRRVVQRECFNGRVTGLSADAGSERFAVGLVTTTSYGAADSSGRGDSSGFTFWIDDGDRSRGIKRESKCAAPPLNVKGAPPPPSSSQPSVSNDPRARLPVSVISRNLSRAVVRSTENQVTPWLSLDRPEAPVTLDVPVRALAITADGRRFAAGADNGLVVFFDTERRSDPITLRPRGARVEAMAFSDDGARLVVLDAAGRVTIFPLTAEQLIERARTITRGRVPTPNECTFLGGSCGSDPTRVGSMLRRVMGFGF